MKNLALILSYLTTPTRRRNIRLMLVLLGVLVVLVGVYSAVFHELMEREGRSYSWPTAIYWTLVTMTTLGFGDITFESDLGRIFSVVVLLSGTVFLLVLLPFVFIQFVWVPWMSHRELQRAPRVLPESTRGHLVLTGMGSIEDNLIGLARRAGLDYVVLVADLSEALALHDEGYSVMVGPLDDPETYRRAQVSQAAVLVSSQTDMTNTNIVFTVREITSSLRIVATANVEPSIDILELAGADVVLRLGDILGRAMATRILAGGARVIGEIEGVLIAEAALAPGRHLTPRAIGDSTGLGVVGVWDRGEFQVLESDGRVTGGVLVLAGSSTEMAAFDELYGTRLQIDRRVIIIGGGRVGRRVGRSLAESGVEYRIVEKLPERVRDPDRYLIGDAARIEVLQAAGIEEAAAVVITTHDDDLNVYLTIYVRRLRPDLQVISRANLDRNVSSLYRAGADSVLSYASTGAAAVWNSFRPQDSLLVAEHLEVFKAPVPPGVAGRSIEASKLCSRTGCAVVAVEHEGRIVHRPDLTEPVPAGATLILLGDDADQRRFQQTYHPNGNRR